MVDDAETNNHTNFIKIPVVKLRYFRSEAREDLVVIGPQSFFGKINDDAARRVDAVLR
ncbi:hypothetical protein [Yoonia sp. 2307UL14-13]|uniref:hypothetical protein n=1 Tax=Yoonia sp. 2307UL14-13 TaxID=3126506 RepID=UPI0030A3082D